jgi:Ni/Co efflux regulator RcnB
MGSTVLSFSERSNPMKVLLISTALAALLWGAPAAFADDDHYDRNGHTTTTHNPGGGHHPNGNADHGPGNRGSMRGPMPGMRGPMNGASSGGNNNFHQDAAHDRGGNHGHNFDVRSYQRNFVAPRHFRVGAYHGPRDYRYRRWTFGEWLPSIYFGRNYWLMDFEDYGLAPPPPGCVWVRYGPDALLIDEYTGEIIQVDYGVFY